MAEKRDQWLGRRRMHLRLRFLQGESTGSYVTRLAARNNRPTEEVLRSMGTGPVPVDPQYTEMYVSRYARERLATLAGHTVAEMQERLIGLRDEFLMPKNAKDDWEWPWDARAGYIVQACSLCAARRGTRSPAWLILPDPWQVCLRHQRWTDNSRSTDPPLRRSERARGGRARAAAPEPGAQTPGPCRTVGVRGRLFHPRALRVSRGPRADEAVGCPCGAAGRAAGAAPGAVQPAFAADPGPGLARGAPPERRTAQHRVPGLAAADNAPALLPVYRATDRLAPSAPASAAGHSAAFQRESARKRRRPKGDRSCPALPFGAGGGTDMLAVGAHAQLDGPAVSVVVRAAYACCGIA